MAMGMSLFASLTTDSAKEFLTPEHLFWVKSSAASLSAGALALKTYRSTQYAKHLAGQSQPNPTNLY